MTMVIKIPVPKDVKKIRIETPNNEKMPAAGPRFIQLEVGWSREYTPIQGGPGKVTVTKVGQVRGGHRMVTLEMEDMTAGFETVVVCRPAGAKPADDKEASTDSPQSA